MNERPILKIDNADKDVQIYKALTHPARIAILRILQDGEHCVCHLEAHLGYRQAYISQQLSVLRDADLNPGPTRGVEYILPCDQT